MDAMVIQIQTLLPLPTALFDTSLLQIGWSIKRVCNHDHIISCFIFTMPPGNQSSVVMTDLIFRGAWPFLGVCIGGDGSPTSQGDMLVTEGGGGAPPDVVMVVVDDGVNVVATRLVLLSDRSP